ncbi:MAG TPA: MFS transporter [Dongiaceae bacterium]|nr:MFS transporter [Dongiaceae bacterium]
MIVSDRGDSSASSSRGIARTAIIALTAFLTLVDLFATQALLPALAQRYTVSPAAMGVAVNACTLGMAVSSLVVAFISGRIQRRNGIWISLALLAIPTLLLSVAPDLITFAALRIAQGVFMAAAFALMLAYLGEHFGPRDAAGAFAAYVTGNVASNLFGRLFASAIADHLGLAASFYTFALLNLAGAVLVYATVCAMPRPPAQPASPAPHARIDALRNGPLLAGLGIGFCILFAFIGTFTYVNFVLAAEPFQLGMMSLGFVYLVFLPSIVTTPLAGRAVARLGTRATVWSALGIAAIGLPLLLSSALAAVLPGLALVGVGTFLAQAAATGFIGKAAPSDRALASGLYLASYFLGGLVGSAVLGHLYVLSGWIACVAGIGIALAVAAILTLCLRHPTDSQGMSPRHRTDRKSAMAASTSLRDCPIGCSFC